MTVSNPGPYVAALTIYPIKSTTGMDVPEIVLDERGAMGDRRWLIVDPAGQAITARECHAMLRIVPSFIDEHDREGGLWLAAEGEPLLHVAVPDAHAEQRRVVVWDDAIIAHDAGDAAAEWCSRVIGREARLVRVFDDSRRPLKPKYAGPLPYQGRDVAFTDGAPLMMLGLPSVDALNARLTARGHDAMMDRRRFRANVWLSGLDAHQEDTWQLLRIGDVTLGAGTLCARCVLTTVDPDTREQGTEPLRTLAGYRRMDGLVMFGVNLTHDAPGVIRVGDPVVVESLR
ncbi:MAG TPA: MOSC N-terminal beta barrel domain-containing protein [Gemmatimonas sp.]|uniref:MOSC domain-containing protein n=1 Tax=Gemmatimonas sp. TaxID=1962908 RepID=UPI002ED78F70